MPTSTTGADEFIELVCADPELLDAEFAAIVAAAWDLPPEGASVGDAGPGPALSRTTHVKHRWSLRSKEPGAGGRARQRSPPLR